ncbi:MAG: hypothetical protein J6W60_08115 [Treponema sp.]|nr:hypothetical protein [Treponema sp.]
MDSSSRFQRNASALSTVHVPSIPLFKDISVSSIIRVLIALSLLSAGLSFFGIIALVALCESGVVSFPACIISIIGLAVLEMTSLNFIRKHSRH